MKQFALLLLGTAALFTAGLAQKSKTPFLGRWDITVTTPRDSYPDWMEVEEKDGKLTAFIQPRAGSASYAPDVKADGNRLIITRGTGRNGGPATVWELTANGDSLTGAQKRGDTEQAKLAGVRAPKLDRPMPAAWSAPEAIFNGKDLSGWEPTSSTLPNNWVAKDGDLLNQAKGANLRTTRKFDDFKLHIEFNCPQGGNSGIYMRGRYEVQVEYEPVDANDKFHSIGAIYSMLSPAVDLPRTPGKWETFDITLVGRRITIVRNGVKTIDNQEIRGITGGALDANEGEPGPFYIQGDHTGGMRYRNITISLPKR